MGSTVTFWPIFQVSDPWPSCFVLLAFKIFKFLWPIMVISFLYACLKNGTYYENTCGRRAASTGFPLSKSKSLHQVFIKLGEYVGVHNVSTKFYNQPNPTGTLELWLLNCPKLGFPPSKSEFSSCLDQTWWICWWA